MPRPWASRILCLCLLVVGGGKTDGEDAERNAETESTSVIPHSLKFHVDAPTLGGRQFWGDVAFFRGWRIQQNVYSRIFRLLDPRDIRKASGTLEECRDALERIKQERGLPPMSGRAVIVIHGIIRSSKSFDALTQRLQETGATVVGFDYPSTRVELSESANYLKQVLSSLEGIDSIDIVVHSMGGLVVRTYLQQAGDHPDPRLHRMVMLATPNHGARMANHLQKQLFYRWIFGPAGQQLVEGPEGVARLPTPSFPFAIIAGARGTPDGWNPFVPGDDDGTISVNCTRLVGAADFMTVPVLHTVLMSKPAVIDATLRFLETGALRAEGRPAPILKETSSDDVP